MRAKIEEGHVDERMAETGVTKRQLQDAGVPRSVTDAIGKDVAAPVADIQKLTRILNLPTWPCIKQESKEAIEATLPVASEQQALLSQPPPIAELVKGDDEGIDTLPNRSTTREIVAIKKGSEIIQEIDYAAREFQSRFLSFRGNELQEGWIRALENSRSLVAARDKFKYIPDLQQKFQWMSRIHESELLKHEELLTSIDETLKTRARTNSPQLDDGIYVGDSELGKLIHSAKTLVEQDNVLDQMRGENHQVFHHQVRRPTTLTTIEYRYDRVSEDEYESEEWRYEFPPIDTYTNMQIIMPVGLDFLLVDYFTDAKIRVFMDIEMGEGYMDDEQTKLAVHESKSW